MASIDSITFDQSDYPVGALITVTVGYTADASAPGTPQTFNLTAVIKDATGAEVGSLTQPFTVTGAGTAAGDTVSVSDDGSRTWTEDTAAESAGVAIFTATA